VTDFGTDLGKDRGKAQQGDGLAMVSRKVEAKY